MKIVFFLGQKDSKDKGGKKKRKEIPGKDASDDVASGKKKKRKSGASGYRCSYTILYFNRFYVIINLLIQTCAGIIL